MTTPLRSGGRAELPGGATVVWSVAEGRRGRRWREAVRVAEALARSTLLEASPAGRPTYLELATPAGLLTLHPDVDERELHGNVVTPDGIRHLRFDWSLEHELFVVESVAAASVALHRLARVVAVGDGRRVPVLQVDDALEPAPATWRVTRTSTGGWHLVNADSGEERTTVPRRRRDPAPARDRQLAARARLTGVPWTGCGQRARIGTRLPPKSWITP